MGFVLLADVVRSGDADISLVLVQPGEEERAYGDAAGYFPASVSHARDFDIRAELIEYRAQGFLFKERKGLRVY